MNHHKGQTLYECLCVVASTAIILAQALPIGTDLIAHHARITAMNSLSSCLARARLTAISRHESVTMCPSSNGATCRQDTDWSHGWILLRGSAHDSKRIAPESIILYEPLRTQLTILSTPGRTAIQFLPDGRSAGSNLRLQFCAERTLVGEMRVNNLGRVRSNPVKPTSPCEARQAQPT